MSDGTIVGLLLFGLLVYGFIRGFDDGTNKDE